jgi:hypothetical protein
MTDKIEANSKPDDQRQTGTRPIRRPWHAPQFQVTDFALTDTVGNGGSDGGSMGSPS